MKSTIIKDDQGIECIIDDIKKFYDHILKYHHSGISVHEEDGHFITIDDSFRLKIKQIIDGKLNRF